MITLTPRQWRNFWVKVDRSADANACWTWLGATLGNFGYGGFRVGQNTFYAHRLSWIISKGDPGSLCVLHHCDNPKCVRPGHLFIGTKMDNMIDKVQKGRQPRGEQTVVALMTDATVKEALHRFATGNESVLGLASEFGVNEATMRAIVNGQTWVHVPGPRLSRAEIVAIGKRNRAAAVRAAKKRA